MATSKKQALMKRKVWGAVYRAGIQRQSYSIVQLVLAMINGKLEYGVDSTIGKVASFKQFQGFTIAMKD